jgi:hypothetical protein
MSIYELGYIDNDTKTILKEKKPTLRLKSEDYTFFNKNYKKVVIIKLLIAILMLIVLYEIKSNIFHELYIEQFLFGVVLSMLFFLLHNKLRSRFNILTFGLLSILKYTTPILLFIPFATSFSTIFFILVMFPIVRILEHATKVKYGLTVLIKVVGNHDIFRIKYYFIALVSIVLLSFFYNINYLIYTSILIYFLAYRILIYYILRNKIYIR